MYLAVKQKTVKSHGSTDSIVKNKYDAGCGNEYRKLQGKFSILVFAILIKQIQDILSLKYTNVDTDENGWCLYELSCFGRDINVAMPTHTCKILA